MNGVLILNKPSGMTSFDCVAKARKIFKTRKVGHAGTLDPMATGVLPILVGNAVKAEQFLHETNKLYRAKMLFGYSTDTGDISGKTLSKTDFIPGFEEIKKAAFSFLGGYEQIPPMYSALKVNGKKLYELARENITVDRQARFIGIDKIEVSPCGEENCFYLEVSCSKGTYIRTLIEDIAVKAGSLACMAELERLSCGGFDIENSVKLEELLNCEKPESFLVPTTDLFKDLKSVELDPFFFRLAFNGQVVYLKKISLNTLELGEKIRVYSKDGSFLGLGQIIDTEDGLAVKVIKQFLS